MPRLIDRLQSSTKPLLWLDDADYSERLLAGGHTPWLDSAAYLGFRRTAQGLLKPDLWALPLTRILSAWVHAHPDLRQAMAAKTRLLSPVRTLLADEALRVLIVDVLASLKAAGACDPLLVALPSPRALVSQAWRLAFDCAPEDEIGGDEVDSCSVYVAEFLRSFGACGVDGVLLEEAPGEEPAGADELDWYQPVINVAEHYRWDLGLSLPDAAGFTGTPTSMQFVIAPQVLPGVAVQGLVLSAEVWQDAPSPVAPPGGFRFATVPVDAVPEQVLARLSVLQNA